MNKKTQITVIKKRACVEEDYVGNGEYNSRQSNTNDENLRGSGKYHKPSPLHLGKLRRMLTGDPTDAVLDLLKHEDQLQKHS